MTDQEKQDWKEFDKARRAALDSGAITQEDFGLLGSCNHLKTAQAILQRKLSRTANTETDDLIDERFGKGHRTSHLGEYWNWVLCQHEHFGATNYIELSKDARHGEGYRLLVYTDSGYTPPFVAGTYNESQVEQLIEGFPPTNPAFKTDRK